MARPGERYSHTGAIKTPRQVLRGGYLSWHDLVSDHWWQQTWFDGAKPKFRDLGKFTANGGKSFRRQIYDVTEQAFEVRRPKPAQLRMQSALSDPSTTSKAKAWRAQISKLVKAAKAPPA